MADVKNLNDPPAARLNRIMAKLGIAPIYELVFSETGNGILAKFIMRVTCPISIGGPAFSVEGYYGHSKKEAKHNAAQAFMQKFLNDGNTSRSTADTGLTKSIINAAIICCEGRDILEDICSKNYLGRPEYSDVGTSHSWNSDFAVECKLGNLRSRGTGRNKVEARLHATARMMQVLMETSSIKGILKSDKLTISGRTTEIVCSSHNLKESEPMPVQNTINGKRKSDTRSPDLSRACESLDRAERLHLKFMNEQKKALKIKRMNADLGTIEVREDLVDDSQQKIRNTEVSSTSINNNVLDTVNCEVESMSSKQMNANLTRLQAVSQIDRTCGNFEKQLDNTIVDALVHSGLPYQQTVAIFGHDYKVFINQSSPPKVFQDEIECTDQSIRVACLTKLLQYLKEHIVTNPTRLNQNK